MAIDFTKTATVTETPVDVLTERQEVAVVEETYDIVEAKKKMEMELRNSKEVDALVSTIQMDDMNSIITFGSDVATTISQASDLVLRSMSNDALDNSSKMMDALADIMEKFDIEEIRKEPKGLQKLFNNAKKSLEKILNKYQTMGDKVDTIYVELKKYEDEIKTSNTQLSQMFETNVNTYNSLVKYILAGEQACEEIKAYLEQKEKEFASTGDSAIQFEITTLQQALTMMEQRTQDLRIVENIAMQSIPMIKTMEFTNLNLVRKINSAFIITLPVFKQSLAQAMLLKRQAIQSESLSKLDEKTNEMLIKNAQNSVAQSQKTLKMASESSIKIETLEETWHTIMNGIEETKKIQNDARVKRQEDQKRLAVLKDEFTAKYNAK